MGAGLVLLLLEQHSHRQRHEPFCMPIATGMILVESRAVVIPITSTITRPRISKTSPRTDPSGMPIRTSATPITAIGTEGRILS